jgi:hypothetical protein
MRALACGSPKAVSSRIGRSSALCCGSTENVHCYALSPSLLPTDSDIRYSQQALVKSLNHPPICGGPITHISITVGSGVIQDINSVANAGLAYMAIFFFRFQGHREARCPWITLLSHRPSIFVRLLHSFRLFSAHRGSQHQYWGANQMPRGFAHSLRRHINLSHS